MCQSLLANGVIEGGASEPRLEGCASVELCNHPPTVRSAPPDASTVISFKYLLCFYLCIYWYFIVPIVSNTYILYYIYSRYLIWLPQKSSGFLHPRDIIDAWANRENQCWDGEWAPVESPVLGRRMGAWSQNKPRELSNQRKFCHFLGQNKPQF